MACNFRLASERQAHDVIQRLKSQLSSRIGGTKFNITSVSIAPNVGRDYAVEFYAKAEEMRYRIGSKNLPYFQSLIDECKPILRVELKLKHELKKRGLSRVSDWSVDTPYMLFAEHMRRLDLSSITLGPLDLEELAKLPSRLRPPYVLHKTGGIPLNRIYEQRTFQRHAADLLRMGIDIRRPNEHATPEESVATLLKRTNAINDTPRWLVDGGWAPRRFVNDL